MIPFYILHLSKYCISLHAFEIQVLSNMSLTYYGMSTQHLTTRAREHLNFKSM